MRGRDAPHATDVRSTLRYLMFPRPNCGQLSWYGTLSPTECIHSAGVRFGPRSRNDFTCVPKLRTQQAFHGSPRRFRPRAESARRDSSRLLGLYPPMSKSSVRPLTSKIFRTAD